jgi:hypothetical protein
MSKAGQRISAGREPEPDTPVMVRLLTYRFRVALQEIFQDTLQDMTPVTDKTRETRLRRLAERQGMRLQKSPRRDPNARDFGTYQLVDAAEEWTVLAGPLGYGMSLDDIELWFDKEAVRMFKVAAIMQAKPFPDVTDEQRQRFTTAIGDLFSSKFVLPAQVQWITADQAQVTIACGGEDAPSAAAKASELIERNASLVAHIYVREITVTSTSLLQGWA